MYAKDKAQAYPNSNPAVRCDIFSCFESVTDVIGRPDGPRNLPLNLCKRCYQSLVDSIIIREGKALLARKAELEAEESIRRDKETFGGREFKCKECGEVFYSLAKLGGHARVAHGKEAAKSGVGA